MLLFTNVFLMAAQSQNNAVSGVVKDGKGESLIGVSIMVKGTKTGTVTDIDGNFWQR